MIDVASSIPYNKTEYDLIFDDYNSDFTYRIASEIEDKNDTIIYATEEVYEATSQFFIKGSKKSIEDLEKQRRIFKKFPKLKAADFLTVGGGGPLDLSKASVWSLYLLLLGLFSDNTIDSIENVGCGGCMEFLYLAALLPMVNFISIDIGDLTTVRLNLELMKNAGYACSNINIQNMDGLTRPYTIGSKAAKYSHASTTSHIHN